MATDPEREYRLLVEDTEHIIARRQTNNNYYLSATSIVLGAAAIIVAQGGLRNAMVLGVLVIISVAGIVISWEWRQQNRILNQLLKFRYEFLLDIESTADFKYKVFDAEFKLVYKPSRGRITHFGFSRSEGNLPTMFAWLYVLAIAVAAGIVAFVAMSGQWAAWGITWLH